MAEGVELMAPVVLFKVRCKYCGDVASSLDEAEARQRRDMHIGVTKHPTWINKRLITTVVHQ